MISGKCGEDACCGIWTISRPISAVKFIEVLYSENIWTRHRVTLLVTTQKVRTQWPLNWSSWTCRLSVETLNVASFNKKALCRPNRCNLVSFGVNPCAWMFPRSVPELSEAEVWSTPSMQYTWQNFVCHEKLSTTTFEKFYEITFVFSVYVWLKYRWSLIVWAYAE